MGPLTPAVSGMDACVHNREPIGLSRSASGLLVSSRHYLASPALTVPSACIAASGRGRQST